MNDGVNDRPRYMMKMGMVWKPLTRLSITLSPMANCVGEWVGTYVCIDR